MWMRNVVTVCCERPYSGAHAHVECTIASPSACHISGGSAATSMAMPKVQLPRLSLFFFVPMDLQFFNSATFLNTHNSKDFRAYKPN
jgi:hypothetical protein